MNFDQIVEWHKTTLPNVTIKQIKRKLLEESAEVMCAVGDDLPEEIADVAIVLIGLAGRLEIDMGAAIDKKMAINIERAKAGRWA